MCYLTLAEPANIEKIIKGSKFLAFANNADTIKTAMNQLKTISQKYFDATHCCWAYHIGSNYRFYDDGEPSGTAGKPILEVLTHKGLDRVMAVVVRYFGGSKLGTGGLIRAYSGTLARALDKVAVLKVEPLVRLTLVIPFAKINSIYHILDNMGVTKEKSEYNEMGMQLIITTLLGKEKELIKEINNATSGKAKIHNIQFLPLS